MGSIAVFVQSNGGQLQKAGLIALRVAQELKVAWKKEKIAAVCLGPGAKEAADKTLEFGCDTAFYSSDPALEKYRATPYAAALLAACKQLGCDVVVGTATSTVKDFFPRVAVALDAGQASDIIGVNADGTMRRPMYAGDIIAEVEMLSLSRVVTARSTAFAPAAAGAKQGSTQELKVDFSDLSKAGEITGYDLSKGGRPDLGDAEIVVSGGRALQSSENFEKYIFPLADSLGAAVGASRAAVDSGYAPNDWQVGQTGKIVAPRLYVAVGISGAIQHLAGMKDSKTIVAINKDGDAPIFEIADYGLVADLYEVVPKLCEEIRKAKG